MATLYIRDVSDDVAAVLKARAASEGMSLSAYVAAELTKLAARPTNDQIVARLRARDRSHGPTSAEIVAASKRIAGDRPRRFRDGRGPCWT